MKDFILTLSKLAAALHLAATLPSLVNELKSHPCRRRYKLGAGKLRPPAIRIETRRKCGLNQTFQGALYRIMASDATHVSRSTGIINPLKTKRICFIQGLSAYRAVNTLRFGYKNQSLNVL
jgi:hypothetical protein